LNEFRELAAQNHQLEKDLQESKYELKSSKIVEANQNEEVERLK